MCVCVCVSVCLSVCHPSLAPSLLLWRDPWPLCWPPWATTVPYHPMPYLYPLNPPDPTWTGSDTWRIEIIRFLCSRSPVGWATNASLFVWLFVGKSTKCVGLAHPHRTTATRLWGRDYGRVLCYKYKATEWTKSYTPKQTVLTLLRALLMKLRLYQSCHWIVSSRTHLV